MVAKIEFGACARVRLCAPSNVDAPALTKKKEVTTIFMCFSFWNQRVEKQVDKSVFGQEDFYVY